jgi:serine/threonine protein kinase
MSIRVQGLRDWLEWRYEDFSVDAEPLHGTYGLIWFMTARSANTHPNTFAVKTVDPERVARASGRDEVADLRREFRMWLALPPTHNVLPALGFDIATLADSIQTRSIDLPLMRMPRMHGSLQDWVSKPRPIEVADRLIALSQALNGLQYLYEHGLEGHGDLKPANLLYDDLRQKCPLEEKETWPSAAHPWRIRVADLGWADAWVDLGLSQMASREYLAPERLDGTVVPIKSDMFSMGVVASQLLQGQHPAGNLGRLQSDGKWRRWVKNGERNLQEIESPRLRTMIERCFCASPDSRPDALEFLHEICAELKARYRLDIVGTLELWRSTYPGDDSAAQNDYASWAALQSPLLGVRETQASLDNTLKRLNRIRVIDFETCESWASLAESIVYLSAADDAERDRIRKLASDYLITILGPLGQVAVQELGYRSDWPTLRQYERYSLLAGKLASIAQLKVDEGSEIVQMLGPYARAALRFAWASGLRLERGNQAAIEMLSSAIVEAPSEPANYYFRASWTNESSLVGDIVSARADAAKSPNIGEIVEDLEAAIRLDADWKEPRRLLESLTGALPL